MKNISLLFALIFLLVDTSSVAQTCIDGLDICDDPAFNIPNLEICDGEEATFTIPNQVNNTFLCVDNSNTNINSINGISLSSGTMTVTPEFYNSEGPVHTFYVVDNQDGFCTSNYFTLTILEVNQVTIDLAETSYCRANDTVSLSLVNPDPDGGAFSGSAVSGGELDLNQGGGEYTITYTSNNACTPVASVTVTIEDPDDYQFVLPSEASPLVVCETEPSYDLVVSGSLGGVFSGTGVSGDSFDPNQSQGSYTVTFTSDLCAATETFVFSVVEVEDAFNLSSIPESICENAAPFTLNVTPSGGSFSGDGMSGSTFTPTSVGGNSADICYELDDVCQSEVCFTIDITDLPSVELESESPANIGCGVPNNITIANISNPNDSVQWYIDGNWISGINGVTLPGSSFEEATFDIMNYDVELIVFNNGCSTSDNGQYTSLPEPNWTFEVVSTLICDETPVEIGIVDQNTNPNITFIEILSTNETNIDEAPFSSGDILTIGEFNNFIINVNDGFIGSFEVTFIVFTATSENATSQCTGQQQVLSFTVQTAPLTGVGLASSPSICFGENTDLSVIEVTADSICWTVPVSLGGFYEICEDVTTVEQATPSLNDIIAVPYVIWLNGCSDSSTVDVEVNATPSLLAATVPSVICEFDDFSGITASAVSTNNYNWYKVGTTNLVSTSDTLNYTFEEEGDCTFFFEAINNSGCLTQSEMYNVTVVNTPLFDPPLESDIQICAGSVFEYDLNIDGAWSTLEYEFNNSLVETFDNPLAVFTDVITASGNLELTAINSDAGLVCSSSTNIDISILPNVAFLQETTEYYSCANGTEIVIDPFWNGSDPDDPNDTEISWDLEFGQATVDESDYSVNIDITSIPDGTESITGTVSGGLENCDLSTWDFELFLLEIPEPEIVNDGPAAPCNGHIVNYQATDTDTDIFDYDWSVTGGFSFSGQGTPLIEVEWLTDSPTNATIELTLSEYNPSPADLTCVNSTSIELSISDLSTSCPNGIVYADPNLLIAIDPEATNFQWYEIVDGEWIPVTSADGEANGEYFVPNTDFLDCSEATVQYGVESWIEGAEECSSFYNFCWEEGQDNCVTTIEDFQDFESVIVYPNPSSGLIHIQAPSQLGNEVILQVFNLQGKLITSKKCVHSSPIESIDLSALQHGQYILVMTTDKISRSFPISLF